MIELIPLMLMSTLLSGAGDILCKYASKSSPTIALWLLIANSIMWGLLPLIWVHIYRSKSMLEMALVYTPFHMFVLGMAGVLLFNDEITMKLVAGGVLSALAIWVMA